MNEVIADKKSIMDFFNRGLVVCDYYENLFKEDELIVFLNMWEKRLGYTKFIVNHKFQGKTIRILDGIKTDLSVGESI